MALPMKFKCNRHNEIYGLAEYYDAVFCRDGLIKKESEFRSNKLSLILDLIRAAGICDNAGISGNPETSGDYGAGLLSSIIDAWRLQVPEKTLKQRDDELQFILHSIESIKNEIKRIEKLDGQSADFQLGALVLSYLPIFPSDLRLDEVSRIYDLINEAWDNSLLLIDNKSIIIAGKLNAAFREAAFDSI